MSSWFYLVLYTPAMNADIVRRNLRVHYAKIDNAKLKSFVDQINEKVDDDLAHWELGDWSTLTDGQKARLRLYYSYKIGEMIFLNDTENAVLCERLKMLKKKTFAHVMSLSSGS